MKEDLFIMRGAIDKYIAEKHAPPQTLDDLVKTGYLKQIPIDPITERADWKHVSGYHQSKPGIVNVRSAAIQTSSSGVPYSEW